MNDNSNMVDIYRELQEARAVIERQQNQIEGIRNSLSWKITKPCRTIGESAIKIIGRIKSTVVYLFTSLRYCVRWIRQYGLKKGIRIIKQSVVEKLERDKHNKEILFQAENMEEWKDFENWLNHTPHEFIDIFSVSMGWNTKLFQRFQHISLNVGKTGGLAIYGAHPSVDKDVELYKFITPTLCIVNLDNVLIKQKMFEILDKRKELKYIRVQSIDLATTISEIQEYMYRGYYIVYEYIDELTPQITGNIPSFVFDRHNFLLKRKDVITVATSDKLFAQAKNVRKDDINMIVSTNGVDFDYWNADKTQYSIPEDLEDIIGKGKIIVGYHGALAKWIDYDALKAIALDGKYLLLLIGFEHDESMKESKILDYENVYYLGAKPYEGLVQYAVWYDIAILPFAINEITLSVSPVKIFEYMALRKPVVTGALPECRKYKSCLIAESSAEYVKRIDEAVGLIDDENYTQILIEEAMENTWAAITQRTVDLVYQFKKNEEKLIWQQDEMSVEDALNNSIGILYKDKYLNQILDISANRKSIYYKELTNCPYQRTHNDAKIIAYYLTQFHPDPHNEKWWGKGITEWNNVVRAVPQFLNHYQPRIPGELGYYDLRIKDVMKRQIELAKMYGIYGFSFYYYWFNGERLLEQPLEMFLENTDINFPFSLCWANENWTRRYDGTNEDILMKQPTSVDSYKNVIFDMIRFLKDERYICIDGKKVITVYRPSLMPKVKEVLCYWRQIAMEAGIGDLYLIAVKENMIDTGWLEEGYDALSEFHPGTLYKECTAINAEFQCIRKDFAGEIYSFEDIVKNKRYFNYSYEKLYRAVMPMWDNTARRNNKGLIFHGSNPLLYKEWLMDVIRENQEKKNVDDNIVFINAWNEWGEGTYLEPDRFYGYAYLNATKEAIEGCR
jgi:hypothetical protein